VANRLLADPLPVAEIAALRRAVGADSVFAASKRLGISPHTLERALAGVGLRKGTALQILLALKEQQQNGSAQ
jgi:hypothetical protein